MKKQLPDMPKRQQPTTKKVKYKGTVTFLNTSTFELEEMQVTSVEERDFNFQKVWMRHFIQDLDLLGTQKTRVAFWICDNLDRENRLLATNATISEATGISIRTVSTVMTILQEVDFLKKVRNGLYIINPEVIFSGSYGKRLNCLTQYKELDAVEDNVPKQQQIANLQKIIKSCQDKIDKLTEETKVIDAQCDGQYELLPANGKMEIVERARPVKRSRTRKKGGDGNA